MKAVWITCSVLCVCGLVCSGVLFLMGRSLLKATTEANAAADEYALTTSKSVCRTWDVEELKSQLDPSAEQGLADTVVAAGKPLGSLVTAEPFTASSTSVHDDNGFKSTVVIVQDSATFEHGSATLRMTLVNSSNTWKIRDFRIMRTSAPTGTSI
jgi:hypothetical protein